MMSNQRKDLEDQEKQLRKELNQATDEFEGRLFKIIGVAIISGIVTYGAYRFLGPTKKEKSKNKKKEDESSFMSGIISKKLIIRVLTAIVPIILSKIEKEQTDKN